MGKEDGIRTAIEEMKRLLMTPGKDIRDFQSKMFIEFRKYQTKLEDASNIPKRCFHPDKTRCSKLLIYSHTIQRKKLEEISRNGRVVTFGAKENKMVEKGIGSITTFGGFCDAHDKMFSPIEDKNFTGDKLQNFLYFYRTLCKYYYDEMVAYNDAEQLVKITQHQVPAVEQHLQNKENYMKQLGAAKEEIDKALLSENWDAIETQVIELDKKSQILNSSLIWLKSDLECNLIVPDDFHFFTLNIFPQEDRTIIVISFMKKYSRALAFLGPQLSSKTVNEQKRLLNLLIAFAPQNFAYGPASFDAWDQAKIDQFMTLATDELQLNDKHFGEAIAFSFFE